MPDRSARSWSRDELILALDLYFKRGAMIPATHPEVVSLSQTLRKLPSSRARVESEKYRSPNAVHLKLQNYLAIDLNNNRSAMRHGGRGDKRVWSEFAADPHALSLLANKILDALNALSQLELEEDLQDEEFAEGRVLQALHRRYERNVRAVQRAKQRYLHRYGRLNCEACGFDFRVAYGERGQDWIEVHHDVPVSSLAPRGKTNMRDLKLVCANCHRMLHRTRPWLRVSDLRELICLVRQAADHAPGPGS